MMRGRSVEVLAALVALLILLVFAASATADEGFGIESLTARLESAGAPVRQAGSHPDSMTTTIAFNHHKSSVLAGTGFAPDGNPRRLEVNLPPGLLVNPTATLERCTEEELVTTGKHIEGQAECPAGAAVGEISALTEIGALSATVYNMVPPPGVPADFGFNLLGLTVVHLEGRVQARGGYHISAYAPEIIQRDGIYSATVKLNGFPNSATGKPLITMPTSCGETLTVAAEAESWQGEHAFLSFAPFDDEEHTLTVTGCNQLHFSPELRVQPFTRRADAPSGLSVELSVPQESQESADGLAQADLKEAVIALPPGFTVSPASAAGLGACSLEQIKLSTQERPECPPSSRVGTVEIVSPLLGPERPLHGSIYLAQQGENPFHDLLALYLVAEVANVVLKVPGEVTLDAATGQITTRFGQDPVNGDYLPQLPFTHLRADLFGGSRAPLSTPDQCGTYTVTSRLTPWSAPESGPPATPGASFAIDEGCQAPAFAPSFLAGTENNRAGAFSPFSTTLRREDGEGKLGRVQVKLPPGLLGNIASVALCGEPQATLGECPAASRIGHVTAGVGPGPDPLYVSGEVFLTGPYNGAPYGLTIEVPAIAGPFDLDLEGRPVVVRAAITVDQHAATATVTTDPLPQIIQGVPLQVRVVNVTIDRPGFAFNPTSCAPLAITGEATGTLGQSAPLTSRFQAADCASLAFKPKFTVSTSGHTSRKNGASLDAKLSYPAGSQGREANIAAVKVSLPKQLPSRLTTLHKACVAATFEANPANCPPASAIGVVKVSTPVLPVTLTGPVYFVSHGGEAFPSLVIVLQGDGVRVDLIAATFISKAGVTSSTFKTVPDVPFNAFELYLPPGQFSALAANGNLCMSKLAMPTAFVAQNGAEIHQSTPIAVRGCPITDVLRAPGGKRAHGAKRAHGSGGAAGRRSR